MNMLTLIPKLTKTDKQLLVWVYNIYGLKTTGQQINEKLGLDHLPLWDRDLMVQALGKRLKEMRKYEASAHALVENARMGFSQSYHEAVARTEKLLKLLTEDKLEAQDEQEPDDVMA